MVCVLPQVELYQTKVRMENANTTLFTLGEGDPDYDTYMEQLRAWTWDDAIVHSRSRGNHDDHVTSGG